MRINSINDVNFGAGKRRELEENLYLTEEGRIKRFFDESDIKMFFENLIYVRWKKRVCIDTAN